MVNVVAPPSEKSLINLNQAFTKNMIQYGTNNAVSPLVDPPPNLPSQNLPVEEAVLPRTILYYSRQLNKTFEMELIDDTRMYKSVRLLANGDVTKENVKNKK